MYAIKNRVAPFLHLLDSPEMIVPGDQAGSTTNTAQRNFSNNEFAMVYLPKSGWLTPIVMDVPDADDKVDLQETPSGTKYDLKGHALGTYKDVASVGECLEIHQGQHTTQRFVFC